MPVPEHMKSVHRQPWFKVAAGGTAVGVGAIALGGGLQLNIGPRDDRRRDQPAGRG
ncbi:MAG: hypothetical protein U5Q44_06790 [Dehalococcoidia bacterium]|nr:hypothetical protein [Dehalococcoidia bacterium]